MALDFHSSRTANVWTVLTNWGQIGGYWPAFEWPGGSGNHYLWEGGIWIGGKDQDGGGSAKLAVDIRLYFKFSLLGSFPKIHQL